MNPSHGLTARYLLFLILCSRVAAQQLLVFGSNALPTCAQGCQYLQQAQAACVPPAAPATGQATYLSCFCQSAYLVNLRSDATQLCGNVCQGDDLPLISRWYTNTCAAGANPATEPRPPTTTTTTAAAPPPAGNGDPVATLTATTQPNPSTSAVAGSAVSAKRPQSWWAGHWKWVLMVILILLFLSLLTALGMWLRRRNRTKQDLVGGRFNDGITTRVPQSAPVPVMTDTRPSGLVGFPYRSATKVPTASGDGTDRQGSLTNQPRIRESDLEVVRLAGVVAESGEDVRRARGIHQQAVHHSQISKGKGRARVSADELRPQ